jgi:predicted nucleic acid-binding protein
VVQARGLRLVQRDVLVRALGLYALYPFLDFEVALSVAHMEYGGLDEIVIYDRGFDRVEGIKRVVP